MKHLAPIIGDWSGILSVLTTTSLLLTNPLILWWNYDLKKKSSVSESIALLFDVSTVSWKKNKTV